MKKRLAACLAAAFVLSIAGTAFAANPFVDVPAKHWAYQAVAELAEAGVIEGYNDGTFRGDKTITRYEMAQIVARAMANAENADAQTKAIIDKLAVEFADELNNLGVRVSNLEKKVGNVKWGGETRLKFEDAKDGNDAWTLRQRLLVSGSLAKNIDFGARLEASGSLGGGNYDTNVNRAFIVVKDSLGVDKVTLGKFGLASGRNFALANSSNNDGVVINHKVGATDMQIFWVNPGDKEDQKNIELRGIDFAYAPNKDLDFNLGYVAYEQDANIVAGFGYKFAKHFTLIGEYVDSDNDKKSDGEAWAAQLVWNSNGTKANKFFPYSNVVNPKNAHEYAIVVRYHDADANALPGYGAYSGMKSDASGKTKVGAIEVDDAKVLAVGFQTALQKDVLLNLEYYDLEKKSGGADDEAFVGYVQFFF